jgi:protein-L-isoaspartate(D-aspartate) O-methyltransferase
MLSAVFAACQSDVNLEDAAQTPPISDSADTVYGDARERMVGDGIIGYGITAPEFVPDDYVSQAYENHPLPIGYGQTISQPYIVALMTQELDIHEGGRVLEIGTGSGYQAAVLAELGADVYTIEIIQPLAESADVLLESLGYENILVRHEDGYWGWEEHAPFDAIIVTAAPDHVPQALLQQLEIGGSLIIPVGPVGGYQELWKITRVGEDQFQSASLGGVRFVPFTRDEGSP